jgi:catechol-2,3-dioxygenase
MNIAEVRLDAPREVAPELELFYFDSFGLEAVASGGGDLLNCRVGASTLSFSPAPIDAAPFYHFALLVPGDRFDAAYRWLAARAPLLPDPETHDTLFDFDTWDALACYCHDPAGNIVELIAIVGLRKAPLKDRLADVN